MMLVNRRPALELLETGSVASRTTPGTPQIGWPVHAAAGTDSWILNWWSVARPQA